MKAGVRSVLVLGASGMLGNALVRFLQKQPNVQVKGTVRSELKKGLFPEQCRNCIISGIDIDRIETVSESLKAHSPDIVVNCIGLVKQLSDVNDPLIALPINSLFPHMLAKICLDVGARLIHISTDCVFNGKKGMYTETDLADARDLYGLSKFMGEVQYQNTVTLRTSIIGHELDSNKSLVDWFLSQTGDVDGFNRAIFSGLPTVELSRVIHQFVIPNHSLGGLFHVSAEPISKFDLLSLISKVYDKDIKINETRKLNIDRSLDSTKFRRATGYIPPSWDALIMQMQQFR